MFGLSEKVKCFSAQRKLSSKGLTYLLHVNSFAPIRIVQINFGLSPNFGLNDSLSLSLSPKFGLSPNEKIDFTFWLNFGLSPNFGLSKRLVPKSEVAQCSWGILEHACICLRLGSPNGTTMHIRWAAASLLMLK